MTRHVNEKSLKLIQRLEGLRLKAYKLKGEKYYTIGYGHSYDTSIKANTVWTYEQATEALKKDLEKFEGYVEKYVKGVTLTDNQFGALVSYCMNRGLGKTDGSNGLRQLVKNSETIQDYAENIVKYWGTAEAYKSGLISRRKAEQELFLTPDDESTTSENILTEPEKTHYDQNNVSNIQAWLNYVYGPILQTLKVCGKSELTVDGIFGNKTRSAFTVALQMHLNELGAGLTVDGDYGNKTNKAVRKYLAVTKGDKSEASMLVQRILVAYGYADSFSYSPIFTNKWVSVLMNYQKDNNLNDDGIAGQVFFKTTLSPR